jgi:hypothetical protein
MIDVPDQQTEGLSFTAFVLSLASTAAIHFGDIPDPSGERSAPNLAGAAQMIDILALLDQKTRGNLTAEERQVLEQVLFELRMRFVQASSGEKRIIEAWANGSRRGQGSTRTVRRLSATRPPPTS